MKKGRCASPNDSTVVCAMLEHCETVSRWWMGLRNRAGQEGHTHRRILVADDEATSLNAMVRVIESRLKCHVTSAPSGDEALRLLNEGLFDVLVTDMVMPGIHGLELVSAVRAKWPDLAIVVTTGFPDDFPYVEVVHAGANDFIAKPHQAAELEAKLVRILNEKDTRDAQMLAELKYRSLFELSMNGMLILEPVNYKILDCNQAFCELSERSKDALMDATLFDLLDPFEKGRFEQCMALFAATGGQGTLGDMLMTRPNGQELSLDVSVTFIEALNEKIVFLAFKDVTEKREVERQLAEVAQTDQLTGLSNKHTFSTRIEWGVARARSEKFDITLMAIDLDNFKLCNDTYGHLIGDDVLAMVGDLIRRNIRAGGDEGFRCGGDEFAVLLMGAPASVGKRVGERMVREYEQAENYGTTMSIGIAQFSEEMSGTDLIRLADEALYRAKAMGKNGIQVA